MTQYLHKQLKQFKQAEDGQTDHFATQQTDPARMEGQQIQPVKSQQALVNQKQFSEDVPTAPYAEHPNGEFVLFQNSPQPNNQGGDVSSHNLAQYTDPRSKAANSTVGMEERAGHINDLVTLNNKRFSDDLHQMTPQDGKSIPATNDRMRSKGQHASSNYQIHQTISGHHMAGKQRAPLDLNR